MARSPICAASCPIPRPPSPGATDILKNFATCPDSQRAWLALEDYFEKLSLSRRDFPDTNWWPRLLNVPRARRAWRSWRFLFLRAKRSVPPELQPHASLDRFAAPRKPSRKSSSSRNWKTGCRRPRCRCSTRRAPRSASSAKPSRTRRSPAPPARVQFLLSRPRTGEKARTLHDMIDLVVRATHEQELFPPPDWEFIQWLADTHRHRPDGADTLVLSDAELLQWLARWGQTPRLELTAGRCNSTARSPRSRRIWKTATRSFPSRTGSRCPAAKFIPWRREILFRQPPLALVGGTFYLLRNAPPPAVLKYLARKPAVPVRNLSHRLLLHLRKTQVGHGVNWEQLCVTHPAAPQFIFELLDDTVRLRLLARSAARPEHLVLERARVGSRMTASSSPGDKPEILDDPRLEPAVTQWLRKLDWFTPGAGPVDWRRE
jgi:hypothetical protein